MKVLITGEIPPAGLKILQIYKDRIEIDYQEHGIASKDNLKKLVPTVDGIISMGTYKIDKEIIDLAKNLKVISVFSTEPDYVDVKYATSKKIYVANSPVVLTEAVAEHTLALMFSLIRKIVEGDKNCRSGKFNPNPMAFVGAKLMGKTLGIIGFGYVGQYLAKIAKWGLNMKVVYADMIPHYEADKLLDVENVDMDTLLTTSDIVSIHCNLTKNNKGFVNEQVLRKMKPLAYLINTSHGKLINEKALAIALRDGWIAGAALDVFENEPEINPELTKLNNVVLSPHIAGSTWETKIQMAKDAVENVIDVLINDKAPKNLVNKELARDFS